jgi:hypothetical protein
MTQEEAGAALCFLTGRRLMLCIDGHYLSLATRAPVGGGGGPRRSSSEKMPGGHMRPMGLPDLLGAWRKRTGFRWVLSAFLYGEMPRVSARWGGRLARRLLAAVVREAARFHSKF